jgi:hypothetical protein
MDRAALDAYLRATSASSRVGAEPPVEGPALEVDLPHVRWYRAAAMHLDERLEPGSYARAAFAGLQDSAPRAALYCLHARVRDVGPSAWEDPSLVQIWFRGGADYVFPRADIGLFTLGAMPREREQATALDDMADIVLRALGGTPMRTRDVVAATPELTDNPFLIRSLCVTGKIHIRWDASTTTVIPAEPAAIDPEDARVELARRFLHWHGPAGAAHFAKWARVPRADATLTFERMAKELAPVSVDGKQRWILSSDADDLEGAEPGDAVRLLPALGDPLLYMDPEPLPKEPELGPDVTQRLINSLGGRILVEGNLVGAWGRVQTNVTLFPWRRLSKRMVERVDAEASTFAGPSGSPVRLRWIS